MYGEMLQTGAANVRRECTEAIGILRRLMTENPGANFATIIEPFCEEVRDNPAALREVMVYFAKNFHSYETGNRHNLKTPEQRVREATRLLERTTLADSIKQQLVRMDLVLPNGKLVGDAQRSDLRHAGGWFGKVAKKLKAGQTVREVLTEADLQAIK